MRTFIKCAIAIACFAVQAASHAENNLQLSGTIIAATCNVNSDSQNLTVDIGTFTPSQFGAVGSVSQARQFSISLNDCPEIISGTKVYFSGTPDVNNTDLLSLSDTGGGGMASGVGVEILDSNQLIIPINNTDSQVYPLSAGNNTLGFSLRYKATNIPVTAGNATAVMYFDLTYQ